MYFGVQKFRGGFVFDDGTVCCINTFLIYAHFGVQNLHCTFVFDCYMAYCTNILLNLHVFWGRKMPVARLWFAINCLSCSFIPALCMCACEKILEWGLSFGRAGVGARATTLPVRIVSASTLSEGWTVCQLLWFKTVFWRRDNCFV